MAGPDAEPATCQRPIKPSVLPSAQVRSLGIRQVGEVVTFEVPAGTGTISIVSQAASDTVDTITLKSGGRSVVVDNTVVPSDLTSPTGALLYDDTLRPPADGATAHVWYAGESPVTGAMTLPNTSLALGASAAGYAPGRWSFTVNDWAAECVNRSDCSGGSSAGSYDVTVLLKPVAPSTGTVDLAFYLVTQSLDATRALTDRHVLRFLSTLAILYGRAGLCLGTITFYDVPSWAKNQWATGIDASETSPCDGLNQMFTLSLPGNALNFFLVDSITQSSSSGDVGTVVGIDGTIAGPSSIGGTVHSGAVVSFADYASGTSGCTGAPNFGGSGTPCGADVTAYITAHEGGHWMGLYHTTEGVGGLHDPLSDTPFCQCSLACGVSSTALACCYDPATEGFVGTCSSGQPTLLTASNCRKSSSCGGADSLMFWLLQTSSVGNFSAQQAAVVRANPVVR
jgi:hypothetical protein